MAYVKGQPFKPQFSDPATGLLLAGGSVEFNIANTATPTPFYLDTAGTEGGTSLTLDSGGEPTNDIYYDTDITYDLVLKNAAGAELYTIEDYNVLGGQLGGALLTDTKTALDVPVNLVSTAAMTALTKADLYDNQRFITLGYTTAGDGGGNEYYWDSSDTTTADGVFYFASDEGGAGRFIAKDRDKITAKQAGLTADGTTDDSAAKDNLLASALNITFESGTYLLDGIDVTTDYQNIHFEPGVVLKASANNTVLFYQSASWCQHSGVFRTDSNSRTGVWATCVGPQDLTQTTTLTQNNYNKMPGVIGDSGLDEVHVLQCGPDVGGADSGCFYNTYPLTRGAGAKRVAWLRDPPNAGGASCNRNEFYDFRAGTSSGVGNNTGIQIDAGDTNCFYGADFEGVANGSTPNATPTAIIIAQASAVNGADNNHNKFFGGTMEACTADIVNANATTEFYGVTYADSKCTWTAEPLVRLGGSDASVANQRALGMVQTDGSTINTGSITSFSDASGAWQAHTLTTANVTHVGGASVTSIGQEESKYWVISGMVHWSFRFNFQAANTNDILIDLPVAPEADQYQTNSTIVPMKFVCFSDDGFTVEQAEGTFLAGSSQVQITHSSAWDTGGANNKIWVNCLIYHKS